MPILCISQEFRIKESGLEVCVALLENHITHCPEKEACWKEIRNPRGPTKPVLRRVKNFSHFMYFRPLKFQRVKSVHNSH